MRALAERPGPPAESVARDIALLGAETDRILHAETITPRMLERYDLKRKEIFDRLKIALREGYCRRGELEALMDHILELDAALFGRLENTISRSARGLLGLRPGPLAARASPPGF